MSMRVHTARAAEVALSFLDPDELAVIYGDEFTGLGQALVVEDTGNAEALVLLGSDDELRGLVGDLAAVLTSRRPD